MNNKLKSAEKYNLTKQSKSIDAYEALRRLEKLLPIIPYVEHILNDYRKEYFTIEVLEDQKDIKFDYGSGLSTTDCKYLEYSTDGGNTWTRTDNVDNAGVNITIAGTPQNGKILFRGDNAKFNNLASFRSEGTYKISGNIMSLMYPNDFADKKTLFIGSFKGLFKDSTNLVDAKFLILPSTRLSGASCYESMFEGCTSLKTPPELPATALNSYCYRNMFSGCTSLETAPELPATTLSEECYANMFSGCTSLTTAPELPATMLSTSCYESMFEGCTSLETAPDLPATTIQVNSYHKMFKGCTSLDKTPNELPATTLNGNCYGNMFEGCTSLETAPKLPATTLAGSCYANMFNGCELLETAPELPATTLLPACYVNMFTDCSSLNYIKAMFTTTPDSRYTGNWVSGVSATGTFVKNSAATWNVTGNNGVPSGWTVDTASA